MKLYNAPAPNPRRARSFLDVYKRQSKLDAIVYAAGLRLRPILMTTAAMVLGVVPLITASGAGAASRFNMGLVIASGLSIGTLFTLFVLPAVYLVVAARHTEETALAIGRT